MGVRIGLLADSPGVAAVRLAGLLGAPLLLGPLAVLRARPTVLWVSGPPRAAGRARWWGAVAGAVGAVYVPDGGPDGPPPSGYARWVVPSQDLATAWAAAGVPMGRIVVVGEPPEPAALAAVSAEVASMGRRPGSLIPATGGDVRRTPG